jgi:protein TonB
MIIALFALAQAAALPPPVRARSTQNLASYVHAADWPSAAPADFRGTTAFTLTIATNGRVTECRITQSSGVSAIDAATCRIMYSRARFTPARDAANQPVVDSIASRIGWVGPDAPQN